jgi:hypothetical protein
MDMMNRIESAYHIEKGADVPGIVLIISTDFGIINNSPIKTNINILRHTFQLLS